MKYSFNESYYGKNTKLLRIEALIESLGRKVKKSASFDPNLSEEVDEIEKILTKMFNFEKIYFVIDGDINNMNAFTIPFFFADKFDKKLLEMEETKEGIRYKKPDDKVLVLNINAYNLINLTPSQTVSIILHEIGHNFFLEAENVKAYKARDSMKNFFTNYLKAITKVKSDVGTGVLMLIWLVCMMFILIIGAIGTANQSQPTPREILRMVSEEIRKNYNAKRRSGDANLEDGVKFLKLAGIFPVLKKPFAIFLMPAILYVKQWEMRMDKSLDYDNEKFADNFATSYGYGKEVAEVFAGKLSRYDSELNKTKYGMKVNEAMMFSSMLTYFADPHPSHSYRVRWARKKLQYELDMNKKYLTPKQVKDIEEQIKVIDKLLDDAKTNVYLKVNEELNDRFGYDEKKDTAGAKLTDRDIMEFETGVLRNFLKKEDRLRK
jgi:hypothetical protein